MEEPTDLVALAVSSPSGIDALYSTSALRELQDLDTCNTNASVLMFPLVQAHSDRLIQEIGQRHGISQETGASHSSAYTAPSDITKSEPSIDSTSPGENAADAEDSLYATPVPSRDPSPRPRSPPPSYRSVIPRICLHHNWVSAGDFS